MLLINISDQKCSKKFVISFDRVHISSKCKDAMAWFNCA